MQIKLFSFLAMLSMMIASPAFTTADEKSTINTESRKKTLTKEQQAQLEIMQLAGGYFQIFDEKNQNAATEQSQLIEAIRSQMSSEKPKKKASSLISSRFYGDSHIAAALSLVRVHGKHFINKVPASKLVGWGGNFQNKINRLEMLYSIDKIPVDGEFFTLLLFSYLEDISLHEERFGPYLVSFPFTPDEYELRIMLADYQTLSSIEHPKASLIFNIGDTVFFCHREERSKALKVYKKEHLSDLLKSIKERYPLENKGENKSELSTQQKASLPL